MKHHKSFLSLGSNLSNRRQQILTSLKFLERDINIKIINKSSFYLTEPMYYTNQNDFYNIVIQITTLYNVMDLLSICKKIENNMGRDFTKKKYHSRLIDIDILTFDNKIIKNNELSIPHKKIDERKYVLLPWSEIAPQFIVPELNKDVSSLLNSLKDNFNISKLDI